MSFVGMQREKVLYALMEAFGCDVRGCRLDADLCFDGVQDGILVTHNDQRRLFETGHPEVSQLPPSPSGFSRAVQLPKGMFGWIEELHGEPLAYVAPPPRTPREDWLDHAAAIALA